MCPPRVVGCWISGWAETYVQHSGMPSLPIGQSPLVWGDSFCFNSCILAAWFDSALPVLRVVTAVIDICWLQLLTTCLAAAELSCSVAACLLPGLAFTLVSHLGKIFCLCITVYIPEWWLKLDQGVQLLHTSCPGILLRWQEDISPSYYHFMLLNVGWNWT